MSWFLEEYQPGFEIADAVVTIGMFDGVHKGHQELLEKVLQFAEDKHPSVAITFDRHPMSLISPETNPPLLTTLKEKVDRIHTLGIQHVLILKTSPELLSLSAQQFMRKFLCERVQTKKLVIGPDFALGHGREGNVRFLQKNGPQNGFEVTVVPPVQIKGDVVSSTRIRSLLQDGNVQEAGFCLGRAYEITGEVQVGQRVGRTFGFPTVNIETPPEKLIPKDGVYAGTVLAEGKEYRAAISIGIHPTVPHSEPLLEANLLDFQGDLYGRTVTCRFYQWLRGELRFRSIQELKEKISLDVEQTRRVNLSFI